MKGTVWKFGDDIDTDIILPGRYLIYTEHAPIALKGVGVSAVIAESFARIFYRNATNVGVPLLEAPGITKLVENEEKIEVDMDKGIITSKNGETIEFKKLPPFMLEILEKGGLIEYLKQKRQ